MYWHPLAFSITVSPLFGTPRSSYAPPSRPLPAPQDGTTALMSAAAAGHPECVEALIVAGASCETKDRVRY